MIKKISLALALLCALCSCNEKEQQLSHEMEGKVATINFNVPVKQTKLLDRYNEDGVHSLQIFVFNVSDGSLDAYGTSKGTSLTLTCTTGDKEIFALVNAKSRLSIRNKSDLLSLRTNLNENTSSGLVMEGYIRKELTASSTVTVPVFRNAARITLKSVAVDFGLAIHQQEDFRITKVAMVNVAGDKLINGNKAKGDIIDPYKVAPSEWYHKISSNNGSLNMLMDPVNNALVTSSNPYMTSHSFYCYPNPSTSDSTSGTWSDRYTRLVVTATLGGKVFYYPISIPDIKSNTSYDVSLTVTRPGSTSEDVPVQKIDASVNIDIRPWKIASAMNETI